MELNSISSAFQNRLRTAILCALITGQKTFSELKAVTGATDGNISVQAAELEKMKYISINKEFVMKKPKTTYCATEQGIQIYLDYLEMLNGLSG